MINGKEVKQKMKIEVTFQSELMNRHEIAEAISSALQELGCSDINVGAIHDDSGCKISSDFCVTIENMEKTVRTLADELGLSKEKVEEYLQDIAKLEGLYYLWNDMIEASENPNMLGKEEFKKLLQECI